MASSSETGHTKNVSNFKTAITYCNGYGASYNPSNPALAIPELTTKQQKSKETLDVVKKTDANYKKAEGLRKLAFKPLKNLGTKIIAALVSAQAPKSVIDDASAVNAKIQGKRVDNSEPAESKKRNSVSQQSYDLQIDHLEKLIEIVAAEEKYNPNEDALKVATLIDYKVKLEKANNFAKDNYSPYSDALVARDKMLYDPETGLVTIAKLIKNYVKSVFGASSPEFKKINKLRFRTIITK